MSIRPLNEKIHNFLLFFNITSGTYPVKTKLLLKLYNYYYQEVQSDIQFNYHLSFYLTVNTKYVTYINKDALKVASHCFELLKQKPNRGIKSVFQQKSFETFLKYFKLEEGKEYVHFDILYNLHKTWLQENQKKPISKQTLEDFFKINFSYKKTQKGLYFGINQNLNTTFHEKKDKKKPNKIRRPKTSSKP